jgi:hypothetical protein
LRKRREGKKEIKNKIQIQKTIISGQNKTKGGKG